MQCGDWAGTLPDSNVRRPSLGNATGYGVFCSSVDFHHQGDLGGFAA